MLSTTFVPVAIHPFSSAGVTDELESVAGAMAASMERVPLSGILAGFTRQGFAQPAARAIQNQATATVQALQQVHPARALVGRPVHQDHRGPLA